MQIERKNNEILIKVASGTQLPGLQRILDYVKFREVVSKSKINQDQINKVAEESNIDWWSKNKKRFLK